jgi:hypothetical protein
MNFSHGLSSKTLSVLLSANERHHALPHLSAPQEGLPGRESIKYAVLCDEKFQGDPRAG